MPKTKQYNAKGIYFSNRITEAMHGILDHPLTIVEAPVGYGKTTAVKEYLTKAGVGVLWQRVHYGSTGSFWNAFAGLFLEADGERSRSLVQLSFPAGPVSMREAVGVIKNVDLPDQTVLVIDDYHLLDSPEADSFFEILSESEITNLHIVLIVRFAKLQRLEELKLKGYLYHIKKETFELTSKEITGYYRVCGINLKDLEADYLYSMTEGWISALYLLMLEYIAEGGCTPTKNIYKLIEKSVYMPLSDEIKHFVITLCIFDSFTHELAAHMWGKGNTGELLTEIMDKNAFVKYESRIKAYHMHTIFTGFLKEMLDKSETGMKQELYKKAAQWFMKTGDYISARQFYYEGGDFDGMLLALEEDRFGFTVEDTERLIRYMEKCPAEVKARHHYALLKYALHLFNRNESALFRRVCEEFSGNVERDETLSGECRNQLLGEFELLLGFAAFNDLKKMSEHHQRAWQLLNKPTSIYDSRTDWTFGSPSVLCMYYRESGRLEENINDLKESLPWYYRLTNGHGTGAEYAMEAEWYFDQGDFENAEISVQKALLKAQSGMEKHILFCVEYLQVLLAFMRGDLSRMMKLLHKMRGDMEEMAQGREDQYIHTVEICEGCIYAYLDQKDRIPERLLKADLSNLRLRFPAFAFFNVMYGRMMLIKGEYLKLIGSAEYFISIASVFSNLLGYVYTYIYLAAANKKIFREKEALSMLKKALEIALPDRMFMPFVENCDYIEPLLEKLSTESGYREGIEKILSLYRTYKKSKEQIILEYFTQEKPRLTNREIEIARLAASGITNSEIGKQLYISENTVKMALKSVYAKLSVNNRTLLRQHLDHLTGK